jgi:hypothetical protein
MLTQIDRHADWAGMNAVAELALSTPDAEPALIDAVHPYPATALGAGIEARVILLPCHSTMIPSSWNPANNCEVPRALDASCFEALKESFSTEISADLLSLSSHLGETHSECLSGVAVRSVAAPAS